MVDVELDPIHYETALQRALAKYRQRGDSSVEESYMFLTTVADQNTYILPKEVVEVRQIFRRSVGSRTGSGQGGTIFEPFNLAYTNSYLLSGSMMGGLATYELFSGYQKLVGRMFGAYIEFKWRQSNHTLTILQRPFAEGEQVLIRTHNYRPDFVLLQDIYSGQWLKDYTLAVAKMMLGEARSKFGSIAGPGSPITLNGTALLAAGKEELAAMDKELVEYVSGGTPMTFVIG
jgi:hypothetical protein